MGDMGEVFNAMKEESKGRRARNRDNSAALLREKGIEFDEKNGGAHLVVYHFDEAYDFWPGTGKWVKRGTSDYKRGVRNLLSELEKSQ